MNKTTAIDWTKEHQRFTLLAYRQGMKAAQRLAKRFPPQKQDDVTGEFMGKMWHQWRCYRENGKDPSTMVYQFIHWAKLWVRYDRKISGRNAQYDIQDYRAHMVDNTINRHGELKPRDRSSRINGFIDWNRSNREFDPSVLASELEINNVSVSQWYGL